MVDYDFYSGTYRGSVVSSEEFTRYERRAVAVLNRLTFNSIISDGESYGQTVKREFQAFTDDELECLQLGLCSLMDKMHYLDAAEQQALSGNEDSGNVKSRSSGGESISYESKKTAYDEALADESKKTALFRGALMEYIQPAAFRVNPFFAGGR